MNKNNNKIYQNLSHAMSGLAAIAGLYSTLMEKSESAQIRAEMGDLKRNSLDVQNKLGVIEETVGDTKTITKALAERLESVEIETKNTYEKLTKLDDKYSESTLNLAIDLGKSGLNNIQTYIKDYFNSGSGSASGSGSNTTDNFINFSNFISDYLNWLHTIPLDHQLAIGHLLLLFIIASSLFTIISITYGDFLIRYFKLEEKFPKYARFIQMRRKILQYSLFIHFTWIIFAWLALVIFNILMLGT